MSDEYTSMTEIGDRYGVSNQKIGKWLTDLGLRTEAKKPSKLAFDEGLVCQLPSRTPGTYFWGWHEEKTVKLLDEAGHPRASNATAS